MRLTISRLQPTRLAISWGNAFFDALGAVALGLGQGVQAAGEAAIDIDEGEVARTGGGHAQAADQLGH